MPEYLAPGVYVEEVDTGSKPIEGVSTSTAGMIGATERGPVNVPILITGLGEFTRWFGERLNIRDFSDQTSGAHCYLPYAVEGFFANGGKRVYITRILGNVATRASAFLFDRGVGPGADTVLLRTVAEDTGTAANPPLIVVLPDAGLDLSDWIRIGDGSDAEYRQVAAAPADDTVAVALSLPLSRSHQDPTSPMPTLTVEQFTPGAALEGFTLVAPGGTALARGTQTIEITGAEPDLNALLGVTTPPLLHIVDAALANVSEYRFALQTTRLSPTNARLQLDSPLLLSYADGSDVDHLGLAAASTSHLDLAARAGDSLIFVDDRGVNFDTRTDVVVIDQADEQTREVRRIGELRELTFEIPLTEDYETQTLVEAVDLADDADIEIQVAAAGDGTVNLVTAASAAVLSPGQTIILGTGASQETAVIATVTSTGEITLRTPLVSAKAADSPLVPVRSLTAAPRVRSNFVALNNRAGLAVGDVLRIGDPPTAEFVTITRLPTRATTAPDPGNVVFNPPLTQSHAVATTPVVGQAAVTQLDVPPSVLVLDAAERSNTVLVSDGGGGAGSYAANTFVRLTSPNGEVYYHRVSAISPAALVPQMVPLNDVLHRAHRPGSPVVERWALLDVQALDAGAWGNRLRISVEDEGPGLAARTTLARVISPTRIRLASLVGVEAGTILEFVDDDGEEVGDPVKVAAVNRSTTDISLDAPGLTAAQQAPNLIVRSREFRLTVRLLRQPDPVYPSRNEMVLDSEMFRYLSMDPRHSRYVETVIGATWDDVAGTTQDHAGRDLRLADRRSEGESHYIRVRDQAQEIADEDDRQAALDSVRLGPEALVDVRPSGSTQAARHRLDRVPGADAIDSLSDTDYIGVDDTDTPQYRTGLYSLRNIEEISIIACPGRTGSQLQDALISQCETMRYRFAVLDAQRPPQDSLRDVQTQRQQYDTKYAALYYPWLLIPDPFPTTSGRVINVPIPPSGHMMGIYARTDVERGVHKAPANEVVRGVVGLQRTLNKEHHDILNPYPVNINVIRDFRPNNRGIRVYGGRVITSDSDWKYVNVRRLLIFIEASIDRGLEWVVFEPNAEPLWARVRRSITNFLTQVWRDGALEGTKPEEAFFVKCDRTTMTQTDIDQGRLICLVGVAPVKPAEFVIIRIGLWTARSEE